MKKRITNDSNILLVKGNNYSLILDKVRGMVTLSSARSGKDVLSFTVHSLLDTPDVKEEQYGVEMRDIDCQENIRIVLEGKSSIWEKKYYFIECEEDSVQYYGKFEGKKQRIDHLHFFLNREESKGTWANFSEVYVPRFDWKCGKVHIKPEESDSLSCQQWLSPPPFCYGFKVDDEWISCGLAVKEGEYNFLSFDYNGGKNFYLTLNYEGHTIVDSRFETPHIVFGFGETEENDSVKSYIDWLVKKGYISIKEKTISAWWKEPIFCGWGQQRYDYRRDHDGHENGTFINVADYATEYNYSKYLKVFEEKGINPGTIIIDFLWAEKEALARPNPNKWQDMRGFIDRQHEKGRRVLLWYSPVIANGLPVEACMTLHGNVVASDPTSPTYKKIIGEEIRKMLSAGEGCLNADGFKIDFTQSIPAERGTFRNYLLSSWGLISDNISKNYQPLGIRKELINTYGNKWGVEIIKAYISNIYNRMKEVKPDSALITHTANPYFANVVDILRLNDLSGISHNTLEIMHNRASIARMCNPYWLIDTDNDLITNKDLWRKYIQFQLQLGIPDTYYISAIAMSGETFDDEDYDLLASVWEKYRNSI